MNLDPQMIQSILNSGENDPQAAALKQQQARINAMRQQAQGMIGQGRMAGRTFNSGAFQNLAGGAMGMMANRQQRGVDAGTQAMGQRTNDARAKYADAMMMAMRRNYPQPQQPVLPPDGMEDR